jgi:hypothetical protein
MSIAATISDPRTDVAPATRAAASKAPVRPPARTNFQLLARLTGVLFLITYATSIPPVLSLYVPALKDPAYILGAGVDPGLSWGALLELLLIVANIGTAVVLLPVLKRVSEVLAHSFVAARVMESVFIAVGIVSLLALGTLRLEAAGADQGALLVVGQALVAIHDWTFLLGPGTVVGVGNGLILGYLMFKSRLVPRALAVLGLIGGPALLAGSAGMILGVIEPGSVWQGIATVPEFFWELFLGLWLTVKGFNPSAVAALARGAPEGDAINRVATA